MSEGKLLVPRELLESLDFGKDMKSALASLPKLRALLAQPSDGALTNEPFCYTTPGMVEVAKAIKAGSGVGRVGAKLVKDDRFCVPLHLGPPAPASVVLEVNERYEFEKAYEPEALERDSDEYVRMAVQMAWEGWHRRACLDRVKELNS